MIETAALIILGIIIGVAAAIHIALKHGGQKPLTPSLRDRLRGQTIPSLATIEINVNHIPVIARALEDREQKLIRRNAAHSKEINTPDVIATQRARAAIAAIQDDLRTR